MRIRYFLAAAAVSFVLPQTASAEEAVEAAIRAWIAAVDATPEWSATYGALVYDAASDTALLTELAVRAEPGSSAAGTAVTPRHALGDRLCRRAGRLQGALGRRRWRHGRSRVHEDPARGCRLRGPCRPVLRRLRFRRAEAVLVDHGRLSGGARRQPPRGPDRIRHARPDPSGRHQQGRLRELPHRRASPTARSRPSPPDRSGWSRRRPTA